MKPQWKPLAAAFLLGAVLGVLAGGRIQRMALHRFWQHGPDSARTVKRLTKELGLDSSQQDALRKLVDSYHADTLKLQNDTNEKFDKIRLSSRAEIAKLLRPEQKEKFKAMTARWDARRKKLGVEAGFHR